LYLGIAVVSPDLVNLTKKKAFSYSQREKRLVPFYFATHESEELSPNVKRLFLWRRGGLES